MRCIYEFDPVNNVLVSDEESESLIIANTHTTNRRRDRDLRDSLL